MSNEEIKNSENVKFGFVAWFDVKKGKGYGFITRDSGGPDIFVHYSDIAMEGFKTLSANDRVSFEESYSFNNKLKAANVKVIGKKEKDA